MLPNARALLLLGAEGIPGCSAGSRLPPVRRGPTPVQQKEIGALVASAYKTIVAGLEGEREVRVVEILVEKQELNGAELRRLLPTERRRVPVASASTS